MSEPLTIKDLQQEILNNPGDIKAEVQLLLASEKGIFPEQFVDNCNNGFRREYSRDINKSELKEDANNLAFLELYLSRSGIFDQLPQGLFFHGSSKKRITVSDLSADYKQNKKKEAGIRKFFQPIEHDFFLKRLNIEEEENHLLEGLQSGVLNEYFIQFWELPATIPRNLLAPLILLLPYACKIAGDTALMAGGLEYILKEKVKITRSDKAGNHHESQIEIPVLGQAIVGFDFVAGTTFYEDIPVFKIEIGPLKESQAGEYLEGFSRAKMLQTFERFFIPAGADVIIDILIDSAKRNMNLVKGDGPVLGYSTYL
jgi:hypothetical protein